MVQSLNPIDLWEQPWILVLGQRWRWQICVSSEDKGETLSLYFRKVNGKIDNKLDNQGGKFSLVISCYQI